MCETRNQLHLGRREFLGGMALAGAGVFASVTLPGCAAGTSGTASAPSFTADQKDATDATTQANKAWYDKLNFADKSEYENATRNLIDSPDALEIKNADGRVIWSQKAYAFVEDADAPDCANPSLWEDTRNNHVYGLFKVVDGIYQVRDGNAWAKYITEAVALYGSEVEVTFQSHNWPHWGNAAVNDYMVNTAAMYKFINDQALSMLNNGKVSAEIAHEITLPAALEQNWYTRQYYGTVAHDAKAVYQRFMGWYDANPVHLHELPPEDFAKKMVDYLGDANAVLQRAKKDFDRGEYQWVAQITNILVFADPQNTAVRQLCADALEQLGYQCESGTWRNCYLTAALELRQGNFAEKMETVESSYDTRENMTTEMILDFLGIALDKSALAGEDIKVNLSVTDTGEQFLPRFKNGPLLHFEGMQDSGAALTLEGPCQALLLLMTDRRTPSRRRCALRATRRCSTSCAACSPSLKAPASSTSSSRNGVAGKRAANADANGLTP